MGCKPAPACKKALTDATKHWPERNRASDGLCGDAAHAKRKSEHNPDASGFAHAFDITNDTANGPDCGVLAGQLTASGDPRVKYIIWNSRIWFPQAGSKPQGWSKYTGPNKHTKHMHVSIKPNSTNDLRPWPWTPGASKTLAALGTLAVVDVVKVTNGDGDTSTPAPPKPENPAPQDVILTPTVPEDKTSKKSLWTMIIAVPGLVLTWITTNVGEAMGFLKDREITKWLIIIGGTLAALYMLRQIVGSAVTKVGAILYNLKSMQTHADPTTNNVKIASPAPREEAK